MIVLNNVLRDPRVMKESTSLVEAGYQVSIIGITDNNIRSTFTQRQNGMRIYRYGGWTKAKHDPSLLSYLIGVFVLATCLTGIIVVAQLLEPLLGILKVLLATFVLCGAGLIAWKNRTTLMQMTRFIRVPLRLRRFGRFAGKKLSELAPDIVHCHDLLTLPVGVAYSRKHPEVKCIYDSHEIFEEQSLVDTWMSRMYQRMQRKLSAHVDGFITVNDSIAAFLKKRYPKLPEAAVVMNATEYDGKQISYNGCLHKAASLPRETKILLFHGGLADFRGIKSLVSAGHYLPEDWAIVLMGHGSLEPTIREIVSGENLENVRFVRPVPREDLRHWTAGATVGIIPYENVCLNHWYCSPNKIWEYPAAGVPILASPLEVMETIVRENGIGWVLSELVTPHTIAETVTLLTEEELEEKRQNCRRFIERDNWSVYEKRLFDLYDTLTEQ